MGRLRDALDRVGGWPALTALVGEEWNSTDYRWATGSVWAQIYTGSDTGAPLVHLTVFIDERNVTRHLLHVSMAAAHHRNGGHRRGAQFGCYAVW